jgi:hypothetical protein
VWRVRQQACPIRKPAKQKILQDKRSCKAKNLASLIPARQKTARQKEFKGKRAMARPALGNLPRQNPCAQCGKPIAAPDWVESSPGHTAYLWCCRACDYRFEAVAYFAESQSEPESIAA